MGAFHASLIAARDTRPLVQVDINWQEFVFGLGLIWLASTLLFVGAYLYVHSRE
jgi:hypothetical protein